MLWTEYRPLIKIGLKGALGIHEIRPIHSAPSLGQSIVIGVIDNLYYRWCFGHFETNWPPSLSPLRDGIEVWSMCKTLAITRSLLAHSLNHPAVPV